MGVTSRFLLCLGDQSKQAGDERDLSNDVPFSIPCICLLRIIFITLYPCNVFHAVSKEKNPNPGLASRLMNRWSCSMRLLRYLLCRSSQEAARSPAACISLSGFGRGGVFIDRDDARSHGVGGSKRFREKALGCLSIASGAQPEL